jgi:hypothetical protein
MHFLQLANVQASQYLVSGFVFFCFFHYFIYLLNSAQLIGKLKVDTGDSTKIMDLFATWQTIEECQQDGVIKGTLDAGNDPVNPNYQSSNQWNVDTRWRRPNT